MVERAASLAVETGDNRNLSKSLTVDVDHGKIGGERSANGRTGI